MTYYLRAAALPVGLFDLLVTTFALVIISGWILIYAASHGRTIHMPEWFDALQVRIYLLLLNRLYLDAVSMRLRVIFTHAVDRLNATWVFPAAAGSIAVVLALLAAARLPNLAPAQIAVLIAVALTLPLFPFHGVHIAALTRSPGYTTVALAALLPAAGLYGLSHLSAELPIEILRAVSILALAGALYGSLQALAQVRIPHLLAYASLAFYSVFWWHFAAAGRLMFPAIAYVIAVAVLTTGLLLAWQRLRRRYGNLTLDRMHGLARPMPRFAVVLTLFVMAAVGLPPFALFFGQVEMLLLRSLAVFWGHAIFLLTWFLASWYFFRMMQRLLCGPHRTDLHYEDLRTGEVAYLVALLVILAVLGATPLAVLEAQLLSNGHRTAMEMMLWHW